MAVFCILSRLLFVKGWFHVTIFEQHVFEFLLVRCDGQLVEKVGYILDGWGFGVIPFLWQAAWLCGDRKTMSLPSNLGC